MTDPKAFLATVPEKPGIYRMLGSKGQALYVGKAKNLKHRLSSYFQKRSDQLKTKVLISQVDCIEITMTRNENEALLLEAHTIKEQSPRYNILMRDDKSYPYLYLSIKEKFPRLDYYRGNRRKPGRYFGPYPNARLLRENLTLIQKLFRLRQCSDHFFKSRVRPCLQYQIERCTAPCVGYVTQAEYQQQVEHAVLFLEGKSLKVIDRLIKKMKHAAHTQDYRLAAVYRNQIQSLRKAQNQQSIIGLKGHVDVIAVARESRRAVIDIVFIRRGAVMGHSLFYPQVPETADIECILTEFLPQYYLSTLSHEGPKVDEVIVEHPLSDKHWLENALQCAFVKLTDRIKKASVQHHWMIMAKTNAHYGLSQKLSSHGENHVAQLLALQNILHLSHSIEWIECFDVSHLQGESTVASCVVYRSTGPATKDYRQFNITGIKKGADAAAMCQAVRRRYTALKKNGRLLPDLVLIDGGRVQLEQVAQVLEELQVSGVELLAIAKGASRKPGLEKIFHLGTKMLLPIKKDDIGLHLLQFIRDEAHRFAIAGHRARRRKTGLQSLLESIDGVGAKRRRDLLHYFGGLEALREADIEQIAKVPGVGVCLAKKIYRTLH